MTDRGQVLRDALDVINGERQDQYGSPENSFSLIAEYWSVYLKEAVNADYDVDPSDVAYMMTLFKIARENFQHKKDNLVDAAGYLGIAGDMYEDEGQNETEAAWADKIFEQAAAMSNEVCPYCGEESKHCDCEIMIKPPQHKRKRGKIVFGDHSERTAARSVEDREWESKAPSDVPG